LAAAVAAWISKQPVIYETRRCGFVTAFLRYASRNLPCLNSQWGTVPRTCGAKD
jgi:hypothetical protein